MNYKFDLLQNAVDSLREALVKFSEGSNTNARAYKFAVLHFSHFLELLFKYHVAQSHPLLIFKNPFSKKIEKENTIGLWDAIQFLKNEGKEFSKDFNKDLDWLKKLRNDIEHHKFEMNVLEVRRTLGRLIRATDEFNDYYDLLVITDHLGGSHLDTYNQLADEYKANIADAKVVAKGKTEDANTYDCYSCGESGTVAMIGNELVCQLCEETDQLFECIRCTQRYRKSEMSSWNDDGDYICDFCDDYIASM